MRRLFTLTAVALSVAMTASCSLFGSDATDGKVVLVTHDSFEYDQAVFDKFKADTGITVEVRKSGDAGALTNQLVLTKASPLGDVAFGVDNTFASRALNEGVFAEYRSPEADKGPQRYAVDDTGRLTAVDFGDVCVNVDPAALAAANVPAPTSLEDLADPKYKDLLVVEDPATSSPGLAFLLATVSQYGQKDFQGYWARLKANGVKVVSGWEEAYTQEFSGSSGKGKRPLVVSYASSPSAELDDKGKPRTAALLDTCFKQVEYAGVLTGAKNTEGARKVLDLLLSADFQSKVPDKMYVYPTREGVQLPAAWAAAPPAENAATLPAPDIAANRERWIEQWRAAVRG
ncbi:thiamine transport system substrate-binding protein [Actinokineospora alba]|uniref:Thiamine transport system substrate-binding protein n=1 Tax=Actinokineospora alba TaxID=504798 RepID=A0A1H0RQM3_9PSEU|nr:thiamine ABC transporter substrate-binding protein [Actinokineospora alba]TDP66961.1 thiamine transport system substrate-binding protein [Actinokineospora alba]SDJ32974.1 thiamine transport system substrate-binding protein [Actinokineospora alba]SDP31784.1 thiamine transport system substrate-binding protein [Actinokineospora alba]